MTQKFYTTTAIDRKKAVYNVIFGERSNGKTYALLKKAIKNYVENGKQFAYLRRWGEDIKMKRMQQVFAAHISNGEVTKLTKGEFDGVYFYSGRFYLCTYDANGKPEYSESDILGYAFSLSESEHIKSNSFPNVNLVVFDEAITNKSYLVDEFVIFCNVLSTIIRRRTDVTVYLLGNTVNKFCPLFKEMGLNNVMSMKQGTIDVYRYGDSELTVAVEYCASTSASTPTANKYFAFDNPKLQMISSGAWEIALYPHLPFKYKPKDIVFTYFIEFNDNIYQCEIINIEDVYFTFIHAKTTPIKDTDNDLIYSLAHNPRPNYNRSLNKPANKMQQRVWDFFRKEKVFYQSNDIGDAIANYLKVC